MTAVVEASSNLGATLDEPSSRDATLDIDRNLRHASVGGRAPIAGATIGDHAPRPRAIFLAHLKDS
jgi:hypothetical protein